MLSGVAIASTKGISIRPADSCSAAGGSFIAKAGCSKEAAVQLVDGVHPSVALAREKPSHPGDATLGYAASHARIYPLVGVDVASSADDGAAHADTASHAAHGSVGDTGAGVAGDVAAADSVANTPGCCDSASDWGPF